MEVQLRFKGYPVGYSLIVLQIAIWCKKIDIRLIPNDISGYTTSCVGKHGVPTLLSQKFNIMEGGEFVF